jgi:hypothetical protein
MCTLQQNQLQKLIFNINFEDIQIKYIYNVKFLGLAIDNTLSYKKQIKQVAYKLSSAGYSFRSLESVMSQKSLRTIEQFIFLMCTSPCHIE